MARITSYRYWRRFNLCMLNRHVPDEKKAPWDGSHYVSECLKCGLPIRRRSRGIWKSDWLAR